MTGTILIFRAKTIGALPLAPAISLSVEIVQIIKLYCGKKIIAVITDRTSYPAFGKSHQLPLMVFLKSSS